MARSRRAAPAPSRRPMSTAAAPARPAAARPAPPPPAPVAQPASSPPAPMQQSSGGGGMLSGIGSTIVQGMAFGTGSAIAHRAVGAVADSFSGSGSSDAAPVAAPEQAAPAYAAGAMPASSSSSNACDMDKNMYYDCLKQNNGDNQACHFLYEQLKDCQQNRMQFS